MPRYEYITPYQLWYQFDCNWWPEIEDLTEARALAEAKHPDATIGVDANCMINGNPGVAKVLIYIKDTVGKTDAQVIEMLDRKIDHFIANRTEGNPWCRVSKPFQKR